MFSDIIKVDLYANLASVFLARHESKRASVSANEVLIPAVTSSLSTCLQGNLCDLQGLSFHARAVAPNAFHKMDGKIVVTSHPRYGYFYDIKTSNELVPVIPDLGVSRRSVFDEVKTPAYK